MRYFLTAWNTLKLCAVAALPVFLLFQVATAQSKNSFQEFQPGGSNYVARSTGYTYGWPACGSCEEESDVVLQFILDESSGSIFDEVSSFEMAPTGTVNYEESASGPWSMLSPGVSADTTTTRFYSGLTSSYGLGTGDFVFEIVAMLPVSGGNGYQWVFGTGGPTFGQRGFGVWLCHSSGTALRMELEPNDLSSATYAQVSMPFDPRDGKIHKWRFAGTVGGNIDFSLDGDDLGSFDTSTGLSGKTVGSYFMYMLGWGSATFSSNGTVYEVRLTVGNKTNCSNSGGDC